MVSGKGQRLMGLERKIWNDRWFYAALMVWDVSFCKPFLGYHHFFCFVLFLLFFRKDDRRAS